jgi:hypothetical protein
MPMEGMEIKSAVFSGSVIREGSGKIVYCKDVDRTGDYPEESFDFLGFAFRPRGATSRLGSYFVSFLPADLAA